MKNKLNLTINFGYDTKTNDFNINGSLTWDSDFEQEQKNIYRDDKEPMALESDDSDK
jgi:hypothetical protein